MGAQKIFPKQRPLVFLCKNKSCELKIDVPKVPVDVTLETMQRDIDIGWRRHFFCCPVLTIIQDSCIVQSLLAPFPTIIPQILWEVLHWSVCFMHADDFYFHFFMGGFSIWNKICSKACTTTKDFSIESKASVLMSGDLQTIETIQDISFIRTNWTAKSNQVQ